MKKNNKVKKVEGDKKKISVIKNKILEKKLVIIILIIIVFFIGIIIYNNSHRNFQTIVMETHAYELNEWKYKIENKSIVKLYKKEKVGDLEGKTKDQFIAEKYTFKALKPGKTTITFTFTNKNNGSFGEIKYYNVTIDKSMKLKIDEKK